MGIVVALLLHYIVVWWCFHYGALNMLMLVHQ